MIPLLIEVFGKPGVGKSHFLCSMPNPVVLDITGDHGGYVPAKKVFRDEFSNRYITVDSLEQIESMDFSEFSSVCFDTSVDFKRLAAKWWIKERNRQLAEKGKPPTKAKTPYPPAEWGDLNERLVDIIESILSSEKNVVFSSNLKDKYEHRTDHNGNIISVKVTKIVDGLVKTTKVVDGFQRLEYMADVRLQISVENNIRVINVRKNRFLDCCGDEWVSTVSSYSDLIEKICENGIFEGGDFIC